MTVSREVIEAAVASGKLPDGITVEYLMESRDTGAKIAIMVCAAIATVVVLLRCYARAFIIRSFALDDWLTLLALALFIPVPILACFLINTGNGRHFEYVYYIMPPAVLVQAKTYDYIRHTFYTAALLVCRLSGLAFYQRICARHDYFSRWIRIVGVMLIVCYIVQECLILFHCIPITSAFPYTVVALSAARIAIMSKNQWISDGTWSWDIQLTVEVTELAATLLALSIPGLRTWHMLLTQGEVGSSNRTSGLRSDHQNASAHRRPIELMNRKTAIARQHEALSIRIITRVYALKKLDKQTSVRSRMI
ncbi:hypothetical protein G7046_g6678 [Stylonectria norvegica]|nr:hypothetical protein G7046_g6678 [Stylonectria norvegica]